MLISIMIIPLSGESIFLPGSSSGKQIRVLEIYSDAQSRDYMPRIAGCIRDTCNGLHSFSLLFLADIMRVIVRPLTGWIIIPSLDGNSKDIKATFDTHTMTGDFFAKIQTRLCRVAFRATNSTRMRSAFSNKISSIFIDTNDTRNCRKSRNTLICDNAFQYIFRYSYKQRSEMA